MSSSLASPPAASPTVLVIGGGEAISPRELAAVGDTDKVIAADSGVDRAFEAGLSIDIAIGDFDSVTAQGYLRAEEAGVEILRFSEDKDETDLELALLHALTLRPGRVVVVGIGGGRLDHLLAGTLLLADQRFAEVEIDALVGDHRLLVVRDQRVLTGAIGSLATLLPIGGPATGIVSHGLQYPLNGESLEANSPRGLSNVMVAPLAVVRVASGVLFAFQDLPA